MNQDDLKKFEPSGIAITKTNTLLVVSDNGHLAHITTNGKLIKKYKIPTKPDLEAITLIKIRPNYVYLGREYPPAILEFHLDTEKITNTWELPELMDINLNISANKQGLESLVYLESVSLMLVGRQVDAQVFIYKFNPIESKIDFVGSLRVPGPQQDLSAISLWDDKILFLYDKPKSAFLIPLETLLEAISTPAFEILDKDIVSASRFGFTDRGQEGIAFTNEHVFVAIDAPHKIGRKDILRFTRTEFIKCFSKSP